MKNKIWLVHWWFHMRIRKGSNGPIIVTNSPKTSLFHSANILRFHQKQGTELRAKGCSRSRGPSFSVHPLHNHSESISLKSPHIWETSRVLHQITTFMNSQYLASWTIQLWFVLTRHIFVYGMGVGGKHGRRYSWHHFILWFTLLWSMENSNCAEKVVMWLNWQRWDEL